MDKLTKSENNIYFHPSSIFNSNRNKDGIPYENYISSINKQNSHFLENSNNNTKIKPITTLPNNQFSLNMNSLYMNMLRYNFIKNSFSHNNHLNNNQFGNYRINSLLLDFNKELKEEYEKDEKNIDIKINDNNKFNNYNFTPLIEKLESQEDERFGKSRFLKFIKDINSKKLIINEEKNILEENQNIINNNEKENSINESNINELEELLKEARKYMDYNREDLAINILETIFDNSLLKLEENKKYLVKAYTYIIICYLNLNEFLISISFIVNLLDLIKEEKNEQNFAYNKKYIEKEFIDKINRRDFDIGDKEEYEKYELNKDKIKKEIENYIKNIIMTNNKEEYNEILLLLYGLILYFKENYSEAEEAFKQLILLNETNYLYFNILGVINANQNNYEEAIKYYKKALELNSEYPKCLINYGVILSNQGKIKESCRYILSALKIFEDISEGWNLLLSNVIELDEEELICEINNRNLINIENRLFNKK